MNMNSRVLGILCMIGNGIWFADSLRWVMTHGEWDTLHIIAWDIAAIGGICGVQGLIALKATGQHPVLRLLSYLPILGFLFYIASSFTGNEGDLSSLIAWLIQMAGMLVVSILALATKGWGWRKVTPLLTILAFPVGAAIVSAFGLATPGMSPLIQSLAWVFMGYAVFTSGPIVLATPARTSMA
jgi:hypothetical protein